MYSRRTRLWSVALPGLCTGWTRSRTAAPPGPWRPARTAAPSTYRSAPPPPGSPSGSAARICPSSTAPRTWPTRSTTRSTCSRPCTGSSRSSGWTKTARPARPTAPPVNGTDANQRLEQLNKETVYSPLSFAQTKKFYDFFLLFIYCLKMTRQLRPLALHLEAMPIENHVVTHPTANRAVLNRSTEEWLLQTVPLHDAAHF